MYRAEVRIALKEGVADPEGKNAHKALELLGFRGLQDVRSERLFGLTLEAPSPRAARQRVEEMCERLLANPVIHDYSVRVEKA
jgi:phosphoribosylformylglycinamidine synthase